MLIPLGTDRPSQRRPVVTPLLLGANLLVFAAMTGLEQAAPDRAEVILSNLWLRRDDFHWWSLATSAFLHGGALHIAFNMLFLWVFGPPVEDRLGRWWFLAFYLAGGAASGGLHMLVDPAPVIGASGAIAAVTGAFLIFFPLTNIRCLWLLGLSQTWIGAGWFIGFAVALDIILRYSRVADGIAHAAHLGGYAFGAGVSFALLATGLLPRETFDVFAMLRQANRRRALREAVSAREAEVARRMAPVEPTPEESAVAAARAEVARLAGAGELGTAARAYAQMLERFPRVHEALTTMSRSHQLELANHYFAASDHGLAAAAYERFAMVYKTDRESPRVLLMLALVCARHLGEKDRARRALAAIPDRLDGEEDALAKQLQAELKPAAASQPQG